MKKYRYKYQLFVAEGYKTVTELLQENFPCQMVCALQNRAENLRNYLSDKDFGEIIHVSENELKNISSLSTPQDVVAVFKMPENILADLSENNTGLVLMLDNIRDPGNLGTIIRIADWYGITSVVCSEGCVDAYNAKTIQATMGSIARVKVFYENLEEILNSNPQKESYAAVLGGKSIKDVPLAKNGFLIIGNEASGISEGLLKHVKHQVSIERYGKAESLNAAIATAIIVDRFRNS